MMVVTDCEFACGQQLPLLRQPCLFSGASSQLYLTWFCYILNLQVLWYHALFTINAV